MCVDVVSCSFTVSPRNLWLLACIKVVLFCKNSMRGLWYHYFTTAAVCSFPALVGLMKWLYTAPNLSLLSIFSNGTISICRYSTCKFRWWAGDWNTEGVTVRAYGCGPWLAATVLLLVLTICCAEAFDWDLVWIYTDRKMLFDEIKVQDLNKIELSKFSFFFSFVFHKLCACILWDMFLPSISAVFQNSLF